MKTIKLDASKLLGFRLAATTVIGAKVGSKVGAKTGLKIIAS